MDPFRIMQCVLVLACFVCSIEAAGFRTRNLGETSGTFGLKTTSKQSLSSDSGSFINTLKPSEAPLLTTDVPTQADSANDGQNFRRNDNFASVDQSSVHDDIVFGLLPANDPHQPANFGTRIQSISNQADCTVKGGCASQSQSTVRDFGGSTSTNQQTHTGRSHQENIHQSDERSVQSFVEQRENADPVEQQHQEDQFSDNGSQSQSEVARNDFVDSARIDSEFRNFGLEEVNNNNKIPVVDEDYPDQDGNQQIQDQQVSQFQDPIETEQVSRDDVQARENPTYFDYGDQQTYLDGLTDQVSDTFEPVAVGQDNTHFQEDTGEEHKNIQLDQRSFQQVHSGSRVDDRNNQFDQGGFQQQSQSVFSNEQNNDFNDEGINEDPIQALRYNVPGNPGEDYPIFYQVPDTSFDCNQQQFAAGIYGDVDAQCQVFHFCKENGGIDSFLCPNGTVFNQEFFVCDWWYNYNCADTPGFYNLNAQLYWDFDTISPSQILSGSGIGGSQEDQTFDKVDNTGGVAIQSPSPANIGSQNQSPFVNTQPISNVQQSFNTRSSFAEDSKHSSTGFIDQSNDATGIRDSSRSFSSVQTNFAQNTDFSLQRSSIREGGFINNLAVQKPIDKITFPDNPTKTDIDTNVDDVSQSRIDSDDDLRQIIDERSPVPSNDNFNSRGVTVQNNINRFRQVSENKVFKVDPVSQMKDQFESSDSTSSDPGTNSQPETDAGTHFPDKNGFEPHQQDQDDQQKVRSFNKDRSNDNTKQEKIDDFSIGFKNSDDSFQNVQQEFVSEVDDDNQNFPQNEVFQQEVSVPIEDVGGRSDEETDSLKVPSESISNEEFDNKNLKDLQQQKIDSILVNNEQQAVEDLMETIFEVQGNQNIQPVGNVENNGKAVNGEKKVGNNQQNNFNQDDVIDVTNINQEAIDLDEILDGFQDRNVAFKDSNVGFQPIENDKPANGNGISVNNNGLIQSINQNTNDFTQKPLEDISFNQNQNNVANRNAAKQNPEVAVQQQKLQVNNIYNMMRGYPINAPAGQSQNNPNTNQQRLSFRPYGQNVSPTFNSNFEGNNQNSGRVHSTKNVSPSQHRSQEQIIFPNERGQRNGDSQRWQNSQRTNFNSGNLPNQPSTNFNVQQSNQNFNRPSNKNWNVPTNGHQIKTQQFVQSSQSNLNQNRNVIQQVTQQNFNNRNQASSGNILPNIQNRPQSNFRSLSNEGSGRFQGVKGITSPVKAQFNQVQSIQSNIPNANIQQVSQQGRNQQPQINVNSIQQAQSNSQNQNVGQLSSAEPQGNSRVKGHFSQSQFQNINFNSANIRNQNNVNSQDQGRQGQFQNTIQSNLRNTPNVNQQQISQQHSSTPIHSQLQNNNQANSRNVRILNNQQSVQRNVQKQPRQNQFQVPIQTNSVRIQKDSQQQNVQQFRQEQQEPEQLENSAPFDAINTRNVNNQQNVQQHRQEQQVPEEFQNSAPFDSINTRNVNNQQNVQQHRQEQQVPEEFQNSAPFDSINTRNVNNQQNVQQHRQEQQVPEQFQNSAPFDSINTRNVNNQQNVQQHRQEQQVPEQFQNSAPFDSINTRNVNNQQNVQQHRQEQLVPEQFQNNAPFDTINTQNVNNQQFSQQNIQGDEQDKFQNSVQFHSGNTPNGNNQHFLQQNVQQRGQGQFQNVIPFNSGNVPIVNNQEFDQQNFPGQGQGQFQSNVQSNSGNVHNGNNQQFTQQNRQEQQQQQQFRPVQQEHFGQEQQFQFEPQVRNDQSFIPNDSPENSNGGFFRNVDVTQEFIQEQPQFRNADTLNAPNNQNTNQFQAHDSAREARNSFNNVNQDGQIQIQQIDASDAINYNKNEPPVAASSINYNGWRPIVKY